MDETIFIGCDHRLRFARVRAGRRYLNGGTCTYTLALVGGAEVDAGALDYAPDSDGNYVALIGADVTGGLTADARYKLVVLFTDDDGNDDRRVLYFVAKDRGAN